jgi:glycosyltransferase involved in cell wall biosynthesis
VYIDDGYEPTDPLITGRFAILNYRNFPARAPEYDCVVYAMGDNADYHGYIYDALGRVPGVVILHDTTLHRFFISRTLSKGDTAGYLDEMEAAYGIRSLRVAQQVLAGHGQALTRRFSFVERVVDRAQGVIVHNRHARSEVLQRRPKANVACIGQHFFLPSGFRADANRDALRAEMGLADRFVVASFGILVPDKRLDSCLGAFARLVADHPQATYLFVGDFLDYDLPGKICSLGLQDRVVITGWLDPARFTERMLVADVAVHLRYPHIGGTPFTPIRLMGLGVPTIVSDIEPLDEIPEGACIKVRPNRLEEETLWRSLKLLADQPEVRSQLGENGRRFVQTNHSADRIVQQYLAFFEEAAERRPQP